MSDFGYKLSRITSYLQTGKINECEAREQLRKIVSKELSDSEIMAIASKFDSKLYGYISKERRLEFARAVLKAARGE